MKINNTGIKDLEPIKTVAILHLGDYSGIAGAFEKLGAWAGANNLWEKGPKMAGVYHDDPTKVPAEQRRSHACLEDLGGAELLEGMERYTISGGKYFVMNAEVQMAEYGNAWCKAYAEVIEKGYAFDDRDHYELYISCIDSTQGEDAPWIVEFRIPIK